MAIGSPKHSCPFLDTKCPCELGFNFLHRAKQCTEAGLKKTLCADLDHLNEGLRTALKDWLNWLKNTVGYEGWRFDFVKGYGPQFVKEYVADTVGEGTFNVGEYWVDLRCD